MPALANAQYPDRPVKIVVGFAPGGTNDIVARVIASKLGERLKQTFVVENKPGAASAIGTGMVAKAAPDGYTLLVSSSGGLTVNPVTMKDLSYNPETDFEAIALLGTFPLALISNPKLGFNSVQDLVKAAKTRQGDTLNHGVASSSFQLVTEMFGKEAGVKFTHITYRGSGPTLEAVMKGEVDVAMQDTAAVVGAVKNGMVKGLAVTTAQRSPALPDVPTIAESGFPGFDVPIWTALMAPKGTPDNVLKTLRTAMADILVEPDMIERLAQLGMNPGNVDADALQKRIRDDIARWRPLAEAAKMTPQ
ncbi:MAG: tripartite tricarboxylate transporter substrate binding protein [Alcaligenaceae bacterium]|nr:tripartite tricarboxylate transporter substrate binding protein [Alcaligenaceae bacterium]